MKSFERAGLSFGVTDAGPSDGPIVVLLHGFPEDRSSWSSVIPALAEAGYRVLAPDLRGYLPGARPRSRRAYAAGELVLAVLASVDETGRQPVHLIGPRSSVHPS